MAVSLRKMAKFFVTNIVTRNLCLFAPSAGNTCTVGLRERMERNFVPKAARIRQDQNAPFAESPFGKGTRIRKATAIVLTNVMKNHCLNVPSVGNPFIMVFVMLKVPFVPRNALTQFCRSVPFAENP